MMDPRCVCLICHHAVDNLNDCWVCDACDLDGSWSPDEVVRCELCHNPVRDGAPAHWQLYGHPPVVGGIEVPILRRAWRRPQLYDQDKDPPRRKRHVMDERGEWWRIG